MNRKKIVVGYAKRYGVTETKAQALFDQTEEFLKKGVGNSSKEVDEMWHWMVLNTKWYGPWCEKTFGRFIHHIPTEQVGICDAGGCRKELAMR